MKHLKFVLNGREEETEVVEGLRLVDLLRNEYGLGGTKESCGQESAAFVRCLWIIRRYTLVCFLALQVENCEVTTIEGLGMDGKPSLFRKLLECGAIQCGFCTPGMIMSVKVCSGKPKSFRR